MRHGRCCVRRLAGGISGRPIECRWCVLQGNLQGSEWLAVRGHPAVGRGGLYRFATEPRRPFVPHSRRVSALRVTIPCPSGRSRGLRAPLARLWGEAPRCFPALRASVSPAALAACALRLRRPWGAAPHPVLAGRQPRPGSCGRSAPWFPGAGVSLRN
jgi:hypothetical protein